MADGFDRPSQTVALLDVDPDLGTGLVGEQLGAARPRAVARVVKLEGPGWDPSEIREMATDGWLGLFLLEGLMIRKVNVGRRSACELFGQGDVVRPWDADGEYDPLPISIEWLVLKPASLAVLDTAFALRIARWPSITGRLVARVAERARYLALTQAVTHLPRIHARLLILFWLLADRWGRVGREGVRISLPLTHSVLAMLVGARRPTVTIGLQRLTRAGLLTRERSDSWLLTTRAIDLLGRPESLELFDDGEEGLSTPGSEGASD